MVRTNSDCEPGRHNREERCEKDLRLQFTNKLNIVYWRIFLIESIWPDVVEIVGTKHHIRHSRIQHCYRVCVCRTRAIHIRIWQYWFMISASLLWMAHHCWTCCSVAYGCDCATPTCEMSSSREAPAIQSEKPFGCVPIFLHADNLQSKSWIWLPILLIGCRERAFCVRMLN